MASHETKYKRDRPIDDAFSNVTPKKVHSPVPTVLRVGMTFRPVFYSQSYGDDWARTHPARLSVMPPQTDSSTVRTRPDANGS